MPGIMALSWQRGLNTETSMITAGVLLACVLLCIGGSVAILRLTGLAQPVADPLEQTCREMANARGLSVRHVMSMDFGMANAFAFPWTKDLAFTRLILTTLNDEELRSVISHELGHLAEGRAARWKRLVGLLSIATIGLVPGAFAGGQPPLALVLFASYFLIARWAARNSRRLEVAADAHASGSQASEGVYARALEKIHAAGMIPAVLYSGMTHPSLYDRMTDAGVTPDFPRPHSPNRWLAWITSGLTAFVFLTLWRMIAV